MRKEILLISLGVLFVFLVMNGIYAYGPVIIAPANGTNYSGSVLINVTFNNCSNVCVPVNASFMDSTVTNVSVNNLSNLNASFYIWSINKTRVYIGSSSKCSYGGATTNTTFFACWGTFTLNRTYNGLFNITATVYNSTAIGVLNASYIGEHNTTGNASDIIFDTSPPNVTAIVIPADGKNYSGFIINFSTSVHDGLRGDYMPVQNNYTKTSCGLNSTAIRFNISKSDGTLLSVLTGWNGSSATPNAVMYYNVTTNSSENFTSVGTLTVTVLAMDTCGNLNNSKSVIFYFDPTNPQITSTRLANSTQTALYTELSIDGVISNLNGFCTSGRSGSTVGGNKIGANPLKQYLSETGLTCNTNYSYTITCTDYAENVGTSTFGFKTNGCSTSAASSGGGGGGTAATTWTNTIVKSDTELSSEGVTEQLAVKNKVEVKVGGKKHYVGVTALTATSATIEISSDPVSVKLNVGQDAKLDLDKDGTYDMYVKLNSIANNKADVSVTKISETIPVGEGDVATTGEQVAQQQTETPAVVPEKGSKAWVWVIVIVLIVIIAGAGVAMKKKKR